VPISQLVYCVFEKFFPDFEDMLDSITIGWRYYPPISKLLLNGKDVFLNFSCDSDMKIECDCLRFKRFKPFLCDVKSESGSTEIHVRSMDISLFRHPNIRRELSKGLGHIVTRPTKVHTALKSFDEFWEHVQEKLNLPRNVEAKDYFLQLCK
jgi:hypothetical protein